MLARAAFSRCIAVACATATTFPFSAQLASAQPVQAGPPRYVIERSSPRGLRVVTWNIGANSILPLGKSLDTTHLARSAAFGRLMHALDADIVCLQEYTGSTSALTALFDALLPIGDSRHWQATQSLGNTLVSRYPLRARDSRILRSPLSRRSHVHAIADVPDSIASIDPVVVCTHLMSGGGESSAAFRKRHSESIVRDLETRALREGLTRPVILMGDLNAVDGLPYLLSIRSPLENGSLLFRSAVALHNSIGPESYTWRDDRQRFKPGVLDYILFTERSLASRHAFVLNSMTLDTATLGAFSLKHTDTMRDAARGTHDHMPVVADLEFIRDAHFLHPGTAWLADGGMAAVRQGTPHSGVTVRKQ
jgi:endonuclease/exonuclease/phosphatase family metal-dependent hydrolase